MDQTKRLSNAIDSLHLAEIACDAVIGTSKTLYRPVNLHLVGYYWNLIQHDRARVARIMLAAS